MITTKPPPDSMQKRKQKYKIKNKLSFAKLLSQHQELYVDKKGRLQLPSNDLLDGIISLPKYRVEPNVIIALGMLVQELQYKEGEYSILSDEQLVGAPKYSDILGQNE
ncbi:hypothetical protein HDV01_001027 [Terramyces sp. JEL0728]|nr:hypothetical protein HDV01_001027 [Terramyces sp. JEL0728]